MFLGWNLIEHILYEVTIEVSIRIAWMDNWCRRKLLEKKREKR